MILVRPCIWMMWIMYLRWIRYLLVMLWKFGHTIKTFFLKCRVCLLPSAIVITFSIYESCTTTLITSLVKHKHKYLLLASANLALWFAKSHWIHNENCFISKVFWFVFISSLGQQTLPPLIKLTHTNKQTCVCNVFAPPFFPSSCYSSESTISVLDLKEGER